MAHNASRSQVIKHIVSIILCLLSCASLVASQKREANWQRVVTGGDFNVDVDASSLVFEPGRVASATFRTVLSKSENLPGNPAAKYKMRLDVIQFRTSDSSYRYSATSFLDSKGGVVHRSPATAGNWKPIRGSAGKMFGVLGTLRPFGFWTVISYRPLDETARTVAESSGVAKLVGSRVTLTVDRAAAGTKSCSSPAYESKELTDEDLEKQIRASLKPLGFSANPVQVIGLKCETKEWQPEQTLLVQITPERMLMLWEGVLLELEDKRPKQFTIPITIDPEGRIKVSPDR